VAGEAGKAPDIGACRALMQDIALKPVTARRRLGVLMSADKMLLPAANSLLKLAEEPPSYACILFLMEDGGRFLPTLRSRARFTVLPAPAGISASRPPSGDAAWLSWVEEARAGDAAAVAASLAAWGAWALSNGDAAAAGRFERLRLLAESGNLSVPVLCDLLILALREELPFEHLFGDIW
jgi:DNA polymerase-3 subunit delta'